MPDGDDDEARRIATRMVLATSPRLRRQLERLPRAQWPASLAAQAEELQENIVYVAMMLGQGGLARAFNNLFELCVQREYALPNASELARLKEHFLPDGAFHRDPEPEQMLEFLLLLRRLRAA